MNFFCYLFLLIASTLFNSTVQLYGGSSSKNLRYIEEAHPHPTASLIEQNIKSLSDGEYEYALIIPRIISLKNDLSSIDCSISSHNRIAGITDAKKDIVLVSTKILEQLNSVPEIRPYLETFPLSFSELSFEIQYLNSQGIPYRMPYYYSIGHMAKKDVCILVKWENTAAQQIILQPYKELPIKEIEELVPYQNIAVARKKKKVSKIISAEKEFEKSYFLGKETFYPIIKTLSSKYSIHPTALKTIAYGPNSYRAIYMAFWSQQKKMTLKEAIEYSHAFINEYKALLEASENPRNIQQDIEDLVCRISFWDEYINRVEEPYVAMIEYRNGAIMYYTANDGQQLQVIDKEED